MHPSLTEHGLVARHGLEEGPLRERLPGGQAQERVPQAPRGRVGEGSQPHLLHARAQQERVGEAREGRHRGHVAAGEEDAVREALELGRVLDQGGVARRTFGLRQQELPRHVHRVAHERRVLPGVPLGQEGEDLGKETFGHESPGLVGRLLPAPRLRPEALAQPLEHFKDLPSREDGVAPRAGLRRPRPEAAECREQGVQERPAKLLAVLVDHRAETGRVLAQGAGVLADAIQQP